MKVGDGTARAGGDRSSWCIRQPPAGRRSGTHNDLRPAVAPLSGVQGQAVNCPYWLYTRAGAICRAVRTQPDLPDEAMAVSCPGSRDLGVRG